VSRTTEPEDGNGSVLLLFCRSRHVTFARTPYLGAKIDTLAAADEHQFWKWFRPFAVIRDAPERSV
jgi:hypothetical protein